MSLRNAMLAEVARAPGRSHEVYRRLLDRLGEFWPVNDGNVYQMLTSAQAKGWVDAASGADGRPVYSITDAGRDEIAAWLYQDGAEPVPQRNELYLKLEYCEDAPPAELVHAVEDQLHKTVRAVRRLRQLLREADGHVGRTLMLRGVLGGLEADVSWLGEAKEELERLAREPSVGRARSKRARG